MRKIIFLLFSFLGLMQASFAQAPEMADVLRSNGKIYTVVLVCLTVLAGLLAYVIYIDRKITKLEQQNTQH
jgi:hypothetical protein